MRQTANPKIDQNRNVRVTSRENYLFLNRKKDKDCDNCGKTIMKRYRVVSGVLFEGKQHTVISFVCRRCS